MVKWIKNIRINIYIIFDILGILLSYFISSKIYLLIYPKGNLPVFWEGLSLRMFAVVTFPILFIVFRIYDQSIEQRKIISLRLIVNTFLTISMGFLIFSSSLYLIKEHTISRLLLGIFWIVLFAVCIIQRMILRYLFIYAKPAQEAAKRVLIIGCSERGNHYLDFVKKHQYLNINVIGYICTDDNNSCSNEGLEKLGNLEQVVDIVKRKVVDEIVVAKSITECEGLKENLDLCEDMGITIAMILQCNRETATSKVHTEMVGDIPILKFHTVSLDEGQLLAKRVLDIIGSMVGLILFGITFLIFAPLIKLESPGPVIFKQIRVGKNRRIFEIWKFRTMCNDAEILKANLAAHNEVNGYMFKISNDPRISRIGKFLRETSIDELPQFWNVLRGDMSLVGTRPPTLDEVKKYELHHYRRISIIPGITGNWQTSGRSDIKDFEEVVKLDTEYIQNWHVWKDIRILTKTVSVVLKKAGSR